MKAFLSIPSAVLPFTGLPSLADAKHPYRRATCSATGDLCPSCDGGNITDTAGALWTVSCDYIIQSEGDVDVDDKVNPKICMEACDEVDGCFGINLAANGSCTLKTGEQEGLKEQTGYTNLVRLSSAPSSTTSKPPSTSTSHVHITATVFGAGVTHTTSVSITATSNGASTTIAPASSNTQCDLELDQGLNDLCPSCDGTQVSVGNGTYLLVCDSALQSTGRYSVQEWTSPESCLAECNSYSECKGASYDDDRDCVLARGVASATSASGYTAFLPIATGAASATGESPSSSTAFPTGTAPDTSVRSADSNKTSSTTEPEATFSILPINNGCDMSSPCCPECDGVQFQDQLNGSYTVMCDYNPMCVNEVKYRDGADSQEECLQSCDQDVTCLAVLWWPESQGCHLCQQGMEEEYGNQKDLEFIVFAADIDGGDGPTTTTSTTRKTSTTTRNTSTTSHKVSTSTSSTSRSITDLPRPFSATSSTTAVNAVGPVGPVSVSSLPATATHASVSINPGGPLINATSTGSAIHLVTSAPPATVTTNIDAVACPEDDNDVYVEPDSGNYFAVGCDSIYTAAQSRFLSASDFAACAASCTGECDGVQFGFTSRCGLYTDISVVGTATGWTVAASITSQTPSTTLQIASETSSPGTTSAPAAPTYKNGTKAAR